MDALFLQRRSRHATPKDKGKFAPSFLFWRRDMKNRKSAMQRGPALAKNAGEFLIGGDLRVTRLGFGAMRITGDGILLAALPNSSLGALLFLLCC
jgi:hypothetical protein